MTYFKTNIVNIYGDRGKEWLAKLPKIVENIADKYGLLELTPVTNLSYNYVLSGLLNNQPIILKLGLDVDGLRLEASATKAFTEFGAVKILAADDGMIILERAVPGYSLKTHFPVKDNAAICIACKVIKRLHLAPLPADNTFPRIKDWFIVLDKDWDIPDHYLKKARQLRNDLLSTADKLALLHGDLHHHNILRNGKAWVMIDPNGVIGEAVYEVAAFIRNPIPELLALDDVVSIISNRITKFSTILELPRQRILDWCFVQAVLAWVWSLEDDCNPVNFRHLTEIFDQL